MTPQRIHAYGVPVYMASFAYEFHIYQDILDMGDSHGSEEDFVFGNVIDATARKLSDYMQCIWSNMVRFGKPRPSKDFRCINGVDLAETTDFPPFGDSQYYVSLRMKRGETREFSETPTLRCIEEDNKFDARDRFSNEFPSKMKCNLLDSLPPPKWQHFKHPRFGEDNHPVLLTPRGADEAILA